MMEGGYSNSNITKHSPYLQSYDQIMENGTRDFVMWQCHRCGWKVDQEDCIETSNQFMGATANVKRYHEFCHKGDKTMLDEMGEAMEESMND